MLQGSTAELSDFPYPVKNPPDRSHLMHGDKRARTIAHKVGGSGVGTRGTVLPTKGRVMSFRDYSRWAQLDDLVFTKEENLLLEVAAGNGVPSSLFAHARVAEFEGHRHLTQQVLDRKDLFG